MRVKIRHITRLDYSAPISESTMVARVGPLSDQDQEWKVFSLTGSPKASVDRYVDGFGNTVHLITRVPPHDFMEVVMEGEIGTAPSPSSDAGAPASELTPGERADYLWPSPLIEPTAELENLIEPFAAWSSREPFEAVRLLTDFVHREFSYEQRVTTVTTTLAELLAGRRGVCQDLSHVLIGMCRAAGIPARYVSGYIVPAIGVEGELRGAGATHAWIEAYTPTYGWRGFDPTHNMLTGDRHVKIALGRDYGDVSPTRGTFRGQAQEQLTVEVSARPEPEG